MPDLGPIGTWARTALGIVLGIIFAVKAIQLFAEDKYGKFAGLLVVGTIVTWIVIDSDSFFEVLSTFRPKSAPAAA